MRALGAILVLWGLLVGTAAAEPVTVKVKDVVRVKGANSNPLMGYGLVVGLPGTGDSPSSLQTTRSVTNLMREVGIRLDDRRLQTRNVAAVMVTASLPPYGQAGDAVDVLVSSLGDAKSLRGGTLLMTKLEAADGNVFAVAQGPLSTGQAGVASVFRVRENVAAARIPGGGLVLRDVPTSVARDGRVTLVLRDPDFATAERLAAVASSQLGPGTARVVSPSVVELTVQPGDENGMMARLGECDLQADEPARVVFNERTGTIVIGGSIRLSPVAISQGAMKLRITETAAGLSQDRARQAALSSRGRAEPDPRLWAAPAVPRALTTVETGGSLQDVVDALNALGASPAELMQVLQALKTSGALKAELEIQ